MALALGNLSGVILFVFMLVCFVWPGEVDWPFVPEKPWFGIDKAAFEPERMVGPLFAIWFFIFGLPLFFFTPDQPRVALGPIAAVEAGLRVAGADGAELAQLPQRRDLSVLAHDLQ